MPRTSPHSPPPPAADWLPANIDRRHFIKDAGLAAAALFLLPRAPLFAAKVKTDARFSAPGDFALNPVRPVLESWKAPQARIPANGSMTLDFDLIAWSKPAGLKPQQIAGMTLGHLRVARKPGASGAVRYAIKRDLGNIACESEIVCRAGASGIEQVESWTARWPGLLQTGTVRDNTITIRDGKAGRTLPLPESSPLVAEVSLFCNPGLTARLAAITEKFTLLDQAMMPRQKQRLRVADPVAAPWDSAITLQSWLLTGHGAAPAHLLFDSENRPLFATAFMLSTVLANIS